MSKLIFTGIESSGKSLLMSKKAEEIMLRNRVWYRITGLKRTMYFNSPMSPEFIAQVNKCSIYKEFRNLDDIIYSEECDIFIDEVIKYFPANGSNSLNNEQLHFITQGAKSGIHIIGASQDFSQVHKQFRLLVNEVYIVNKIIGSRRPMKTSPPVKKIWGICMKRSVDPRSFKGDNVTMEGSKWPGFFLIRKVDCDRFDTSYKIPMTTLPVKKLRKQIEHCEEDDFKRVRYI